VDPALLGAFDDMNEISTAKRLRMHEKGLPSDGSYDFVAGHITLSRLKKAFSNGRYVTILREPRSRILSTYLYFRGMSRKQLQPWGLYANRLLLARERLALTLSSKSIATLFDNIATRLLLSPHPAIPVNGFINEQDHNHLFNDAIAKLPGVRFR
jgi:hypothetical protein